MSPDLKLLHTIHLFSSLVRINVLLPTLIDGHFSLGLSAVQSKHQVGTTAMFEYVMLFS